MEEAERIDEQQEGQGSSVAMDKELAQAEGLKQKIQEALKAFAQSDRELINRTDPDCALMHSVQGSHASYNVQSVVDEKHGLIVHAEAVSESSDINQFAVQIDPPRFASDTFGNGVVSAGRNLGQGGSYDQGG